MVLRSVLAYICLNKCCQVRHAVSVQWQIVLLFVELVDFLFAIRNESLIGAFCDDNDNVVFLF